MDDRHDPRDAESNGDRDGLSEPLVTGPPTGRVRIIGAEQVSGGTDAGERADDGGEQLFDESESPGDELGTADGAEQPLLQHWTEAPTGEVPSILARERSDEGDDPWSAVPAPTWREGDSDWEAHDETFEPAMLAMEDDSTISDRHDTLDEERRPWAFDLSSDDEADDMGDLVDDELFGPSGLDDLSDDETLVVPVVRSTGSSGSDTPQDTWLDDDDDVREPGAVSGDAPRGAADLTDEPLVLNGVNAGSEEVLEGDDPRVMGESGIVPPEGRFGRAKRDRRRSRPVPTAPPAGEGGKLPATSVSSRPVPPAPVRPPARPTPKRAPAPTGAGAHRPGGRNMPAAVVAGLILGAAGLIAFKLGTVATMVVATVVVFLAAVEAFAAFRKGGYHPAVLLGWVAIVSLMVATYNKGQVALPLILVLVVALTMLWYVAGVERGADPLMGTGATLFVFCWVGVFGSFAALLLNPNLFPDRHGIAFLVGAVIVTVVYDIAALAVGSWIGSRQLAPSISPGKTWEGAIGGAVAAVLAGVLVVHYIHPWTPGSAAVLGLVVAVFAPLGDLFESVVKRHLGLKDIGRMLPGHGGILDRVDGLIFVIPATYYLVKAFNLG
jgi:phosphatidate cytidylyltransferase